MKSIFRQREVEKIYEIKHGTEILSEVESVKIYDGADKCVLSDKVIGTYDIETPILEVGEEFFIDDIGELVMVEKRVRSSDGTVTYYVKDKVVETERTRKSYEFCINRISQFEKFMKYKEEYRYKNRFFNFRKA